jgi:hypothetical protein
MTKNIGRNRNINTDPELSDGITLNSTTSTKILDANPKRTEYIVSNPSAHDVWIKEQPAAEDNDKKGIMLYKRSVASINSDDVYPGEISAIAVSGTPTIYITEK